MFFSYEKLWLEQLIIPPDNKISTGSDFRWYRTTLRAETQNVKLLIGRDVWLNVSCSVTVYCALIHSSAAKIFWLLFIPLHHRTTDTKIPPPPPAATPAEFLSNFCMRPEKEPLQMWYNPIKIIHVFGGAHFWQTRAFFPEVSPRGRREVTGRWPSSEASPSPWRSIMRQLSGKKKNLLGLADSCEIDAAVLEEMFKKKFFFGQFTEATS